MRTVLKRIPWFYLFFTVYPLLFLWSVNVSEIDPSVVVRPLLVTLFASAVLYFILYVSFRNSNKAALIGVLILLLFFSYGHLYYKARTMPVLAILSHHRTLLPIYLLLLGLGIWGILRSLRQYADIARFLNAISLALVGLQVFQLGYAYIRTAYAVRQPLKAPSGLMVTASRDELPDVYFIVLDTYMRADALDEEMGFDNTSFLTALEELGFYVAPCSRANYAFTRGAIASALNMEYLPALEAASGRSVEEDSFWVIIDKNEVRRQLEGLGYQTVAFRNEYPWLEWTDVDVFLGLDRPSIGSRYLYPFEDLYIKSTAGVLFSALNTRLDLSWLSPFFSSGQESASNPEIPSTLSPYLRHHVESQFFLLEKLTEVPAIREPKLVYVHFMIPHGPYVFGPNGEILPEAVYTESDDSAIAANSPEEQQGYLNGVSFINHRILPVLREIIHRSKNPPVIILQGDHGFRDNRPGKYTILNAYYLPAGHDGLYPSITPVNSFRLILNEYFGAHYPLLRDVTYDGETIVPETFSGCLP